MAEGDRQMLPPSRTRRKLLPKWCMHSSCLSLSVMIPVCARAHSERVRAARERAGARR